LVTRLHYLVVYISLFCFNRLHLFTRGIKELISCSSIRQIRIRYLLNLSKFEPLSMTMNQIVPMIFLLVKLVVNYVRGNYGVGKMVIF
jgi:hypothetical protein